MGVPEGNGPLKQGVLDALENIRGGIEQFRFRDEGFFIGGPVAPLKAKILNMRSFDAQL